MTALFVAALAAGAIGSLHCSLMCGPLALAGCRTRRDAAAYVAGRAAAYAATGALVGAIGKHALCILPLGAVHGGALALVAGFALYRAVRAVRPSRRGAAPLVRLGRPSRFADFVRAHWPRRGLGLGLATALLPCGMLVSAWTLAMASGGALPGVLVMSAFAAASLPGLLAPLVARRLAPRVAIPAWAQAALWSALAVWLALRPLLMAAHHH